jgi:hypothetical protein
VFVPLDDVLVSWCGRLKLGVGGLRGVPGGGLLRSGVSNVGVWGPGEDGYAIAMFGLPWGLKLWLELELCRLRGGVEGRGGDEPSGESGGGRTEESRFDIVVELVFSFSYVIVRVEGRGVGRRPREREGEAPG